MDTRPVYYAAWVWLRFGGKLLNCCNFIPSRRCNLKIFLQGHGSRPCQLAHLYTSTVPPLFTLLLPDQLKIASYRPITIECSSHQWFCQHFHASHFHGVDMCCSLIAFKYYEFPTIVFPQSCRFTSCLLRDVQVTIRLYLSNTNVQYTLPYGLSSLFIHKNEAKLSKRFYLSVRLSIQKIIEG